MAKRGFNINSINPSLLLVVGAMFAGYKALQKFGLFNDKSEREAEAANENTQKLVAWDPSYWKTPGVKTILTINAAQLAAKTIWDAWGIFNDNEEQVYGVFRSLKTQAQVSEVAQLYYDTYHEDLLESLKNRLSESEFSVIAKMVNKLPVNKAK